MAGELSQWRACYTQLLYDGYNYWYKYYLLTTRRWVPGDFIVLCIPEIRMISVKKRHSIFVVYYVCVSLRFTVIKYFPVGW